MLPLVEMRSARQSKKVEARPEGSDSDAPPRDFSVPALERGMAVLEVLSGQREGLGLVGLATAVNAPVNSVFRIASALEQMGYLKRDAASRKFRLSRRMLEVGLGAVHEENIVEVSFEALRAMRDDLGETVALGTLLPEKALGVILLALDHLYDFGMRLRIGFEFALHCSAPGKILLATLPEEERRSVLGRMRLERRTKATVTDRVLLERELLLAARDGWAVDREEFREGTYCVAAAVRDAFGYPAGAIWLTGMIERLPADGWDSLGQKVKGYADRISRRLGAPAAMEEDHAEE